MTERQPNNPLHGVTLEMMLREMVDQFGWDGLARDIPINCFLVDPTMTSALKYLRKAPRARQKVEEVYARFAARRRG
ncbi:MAG TPA: VF530 family protein [Candidatus Eisenbacteria bacterium]|nr:VF530 family protein [Candidatus Eisenbacteria bacterium]